MSAVMQAVRRVGDGLSYAEWGEIQDTQPFTLVSHNLAQIGSLSLERYLSHNIDGSDRTYDLAALSSQTDVPAHMEGLRPTPPHEASISASPISNNPVNALSRLHKACRRAFGSLDALKFEFLEGGPYSKQCILTIARPNGSTRSYTTKPTFSRKNDAKISAASTAIDMGAIDFILRGDPEPSKTKKGLVLAPLDIPDQSNLYMEADPPVGDPAIEEIETCCREWRAGRVKPHWVNFNEPKSGNNRGSALEIRLSPHLSKVYSTNTIYDTDFHAKQACAKLALEQGVLNFVKHGDGQSQPAAAAGACKDDEKATDSKDSTPAAGLSLQSFYETLPKPFPETVGDKTAAEINAPAWLNSAIQTARGGRLSQTFIWIADGTLGLHGCLLRLERPGESRSYMVNASFPKRIDAKAAVCLKAMSQGVGNYIRAVGNEAMGRVTPAMRQLAIDHVFPILVSEWSKVKPGTRPTYDFQKDKNAFGCSMKVVLSSTPTPGQIREYSIPAEYRTKADAKVSLALLAVQQGLIEFLRFRGQPLPHKYVPSLARRCADVINGSSDHKRKEVNTDGQEGQERTKRRKLNKNGKNPTEQGELQPRQEAVIRQSPHALPTRPSQFQNTYRHDRHDEHLRKKPYVSGSGGLAPMPGLAQASHRIGQDRCGSRNVGSSTKSIGGGLGDHHHGGVAAPPLPETPALAQGSVPPYTPRHPGFHGEWAMSYTSHSPYEPFPYVGYPRMLPDQVVGTANYPVPQYARTDPSSVPYCPATGLDHYTHYQYYQPAQLLSYYPQPPQVVSTGGPPPPIRPPEGYNQSQLHYPSNVALPAQQYPNDMHDGVGPNSHSASRLPPADELPAFKKEHSPEPKLGPSAKKPRRVSRYRGLRGNSRNSHRNAFRREKWKGGLYAHPETTDAVMQAVPASQGTSTAKLLGPPNASDDPRRRTDLKGKLTVAVERAPRSHVTALLGTEGE